MCVSCDVCAVCVLCVVCRARSHAARRPACDRDVLVVVAYGGRRAVDAQAQRLDENVKREERERGIEGEARITRGKG